MQRGWRTTGEYLGKDAAKLGCLLTPVRRQRRITLSLKASGGIPFSFAMPQQENLGCHARPVAVQPAIPGRPLAEACWAAWFQS